MDIFFEIAVALVVSAVCGIIVYLLKQPTIVGFIFAGIVIGYFGGLQDQSHLDIVKALSSIGVALLLFIIGLELNLRDLKKVGLPAVVIGIGQVVITFLAGYGLTHAMGFSPIISTYLGIALSFSSTAIVVRLLSEKKDLKSLYGRISIGFILLQDLIAILITIYLAGINTAPGPISNAIITLMKGAVFVILAYVLSKNLPKLLDRIGGSQDLLYLFSIAWAVGMGALFSSKYIGLSIETGGFLAGVALANSSEHFQIGARLKPLRDFFLIILFMGLGARMIAAGGHADFSLIFLLTSFILIMKPLVVFFFMIILSYRARTSFLSAVTTAQASEFSFIIMVFGEELGHVGHSEVATMAFAATLSIFASSYLIIYSNEVYKRVKPFLKIFESKTNLKEEKNEETYLENHIVLVGVHRMGQNILRALSQSEEDFVAVDFDPRVIESLREVGLPAFYGDITDSEIQELVGLTKARLLISTIPDVKDNAAILNFIKKHNREAKTILTAEGEHEAEDLYELGADYVLLPHFVGGLEIADLIVKDRDLSGLETLRNRDFGIIKKSF